MTTQEMIDELQASLGNRTDITAARYTTWLNWAQYDLCGFHRKRMFTPARFRVLEGRVVANITIDSGLATAQSSTTVTIGSLAGTYDDDEFNDCVVKVTAHAATAPDGLLNQVRMITDYVGATGQITIDEVWDTNPDAQTTLEIYRRVFDLETLTGLDPDEDLWVIERLETLRGTEIEKKDWEDLINVDMTTAIAETPSEYARRGDSIIFDSAIEDELSLRFWYYRYPTLLSSTTPTVECELPEAWHEIVILGAIYRGFEKLMEPDRALEAKAQYVDEATNRITAYQLEDEHIERNLKARSYNVEL